MWFAVEHICSYYTHTNHCDLVATTCYQWNVRCENFFFSKFFHFCIGSTKRSCLVLEKFPVPSSRLLKYKVYIITTLQHSYPFITDSLIFELQNYNSFIKMYLLKFNNIGFELSNESRNLSEHVCKYWFNFKFYRQCVLFHRNIRSEKKEWYSER